MLQTARLNLLSWCERHRNEFAALHADPEVMADQGGPTLRAVSDLKFDRYRDALQKCGISRWAVEDCNGRFIGYAGVMPRCEPDHPLGPHYEIGWRLVRSAWGHGYAAEAAQAALDDAFRTIPTKDIFSYTSEANQRSQAVMGRLGLQRDPSRDFVAEYAGVGRWRGLVWKATPRSST